MSISKKDIPCDPSNAQAMLAALETRVPRPTTNEWLLVAEVAEHLAAETDDRNWCDVVVAAYVGARPINTAADRLEEMVARTRLIRRFGVDTTHRALTAEEIISWLRESLEGLDLAQELRRSRELRDLPAAGSQDASWVKRLRRARELKRVAKVAKSLGEAVELPQELAVWSEAAGDL